MKPSVILVLAVLAAASAGWWLSRSKNGLASPLTILPDTEAAQLQLPSSVGTAQPPAPTGATMTPGATVTQQDTRDAMMAKARVALEITQPTERLAAFQRLLAETTDLDGLDGILEAFQELFRAGRRFDPEWQAFWHGIAAREVQTALSLIQKHGPDTSWNAAALSMTLKEWGGRNPTAAIPWLAAHESGLKDHSFDEATLGLISGYADHDLEGAARYALTVVKPDDPLSDRVTGALARRAMQQRGATGITAWFDRLGSDEERRRMFRSVADSLGSAGLEARIDWLTAQAQAPYRNEVSYRDAASQLAGDDPSAAMDFVVNVGRSPKDGGFPGIGAASFEWLLRDETGFTQWFTRLPEGDVRTSVLKALNNSLTNDAKLASDKRARAQSFLKTVGG